MKNEELRLPHFIDYQRTLGVDRFSIKFFSQCDSYLDVINETHDLTAHFSQSQFHGSSAQLVALGLLRMPVEFGHFVSSETGE